MYLILPHIRVLSFGYRSSGTESCESSHNKRNLRFSRYCVAYIE
nr:MAG TPA: hypothetical protein [Caudoviricetes sp.]